MMELIALCAPWVLLIICVAGIGLLVFKKWKWTIGLLLLAIAGNWYFECFSLHIPIGSADEGCQTLRVMSFNCNLSPQDSDYFERLNGIVELVEKENADVVFLTENFNSNIDTLGRILNKHYPYCINETNAAGNTTYSKYKIVRDSTMIDQEVPHAITFVKILYGGNPIYIFGCHLASNNFDSSLQYMPPDSVENSQQSKAYIRNVMDASRYRETECKELLNVLNGIEDPCIVMGDMNDVAGSPTMNVLAKAHFKDALWERGFGYGATIHKPLPYRIDHILYREGTESNERGIKVKKRLNLKRIKKIDSNGLSDHDALVAKFSIKKIIKQ